MSKKKLLRYDDLIIKLKSDGINFNIVDEKNARAILSEKTYYFKIGSFRKNFPKGKDNKYSIEFAYLEDIASLDMQLRYILLQFALDVEHSLKSFIMHDITCQKDEDGYSIMVEYFKEFDKQKNYIFNSVAIKKDEDGNILTFSQGFEKYYNDPPIWVCLELMDFGQLVKFINFYCERKNVKNLKPAKNIVSLARNIRNKCAHSKPILLHLTPDENQKVSASMKAIGYTTYRLSDEQLSNKVYLDTIALFYLHRKYCSQTVRKTRKNSMEEWLKRFDCNISYYNDSRDIKFYRALIRKLVDKHI